MNKNAQVQQVFIYMMVILVVGGLLLIGFRSINNIIDKGCEVEYTNFVNQLEGELERNTRVGFVQRVEISAPCDYEEICFAQETSNDPVISASVAANAENIFLRRDGFTEPLLRHEPLNFVPGSDLCIEVNTGRFEFLLEGVGRGSLNVSR